MYTIHQIGGDFSLCGTKGVNAQTCPLVIKNIFNQLILTS